MFSNVYFKARKATVFVQALTGVAESTRRYQLWYQQPITEDTAFAIKTQDIMTGYSYDVMIVTQNQKITKLGWPSSQRPTSCQDKTALSVVASYCWFIDVKTAFDTRNWSLSQFKVQAINHAYESTGISELWYQHTSTKDTTITNKPRDILNGWNSDVKIVTRNRQIKKAGWPTSQRSTTRQEK